ncbi:hypothetical protein HAX54_015758 [Datura stramonium]|uniref:Uncharacterized protein n=1 Tax=Datura stramonium TaxID=4076 RepID=A0ABS8UHP0_DATST|nr:hypothetical protein [Datura stramonium]
MVKTAIKSWLLSLYTVPILYSRDKLEYITDMVVQTYGIAVPGVTSLELRGAAGDFWSQSITSDVVASTFIAKDIHCLRQYPAKILNKPESKQFDEAILSNSKKTQLGKLKILSFDDGGAPTSLPVQTTDNCGVPDKGILKVGKVIFFILFYFDDGNVRTSLHYLLQYPKTHRCHINIWAHPH